MTAELVRLYHDQTSHGAGHDRSRLVRFRPLDPTNQPDPFKRYPSLSVEPLAEEDPLGNVLFFTGGVTRRSSHSWFRTAMSAGNLHPVEVYVIGPDCSVRHYAPLEHGLTTLREGSREAAALVFTGIPWRTCWKYGERGWRHLYWDAGAMAANLLYLDDTREVHVDFDDDALCRLLGLDGTTEFPLAVAGEVPRVSDDLSPLDLDVAPISRAPIHFPLVTEVQRATTPSFGHLAGYSPGKRPRKVEDLILRRGSTRMFRPEPVPERAFREPMAAAESAGPLLEHLVAVHAVDGVQATWDRELTQHLCYDQPLGGDSAYTVFHSADLDGVLAKHGPRAYRAATFEAGLAAGRLQLAAFDAGIGATGLTFYDDEVRAAFGTARSCLLVTAVGVPDYRSVKGGRPGQPAELRRFDELMVRLQTQLYRRRQA